MLKIRSSEFSELQSFLILYYYNYYDFLTHKYKKKTKNVINNDYLDFFISLH